MPKKSHHYVPQFILKNFGNYEEEFDNFWIWVIDKDDKSIRKKGIGNVLQINHLYSSFADDGTPHTGVEDYLSLLESKFSHLLRKIEVESSKANPNYHNIIGIEERALLATHTAWQIKRTAGFMQELAKDYFSNIESENDIQTTSFEDKNALIYILDSLGTQDHNFIEYIYARNLIFTLLPQNIETGFVISDNPVLITNAAGKNGLAYPDTEISIPLTRKIAVSFFHFGRKISYRILDERSLIRKLNIEFGKNSHRYVLGPDHSQLSRLVNQIGDARFA